MVKKNIYRKIVFKIVKNMVEKKMGTKDLLIQSKRCLVFSDICAGHLYMFWNRNYKWVHSSHRGASGIDDKLNNYYISLNISCAPLHERTNVFGGQY